MDTINPTERALIDWWHPRADGPAMRLREIGRAPDVWPVVVLDVAVDEGRPPTLVVDAEVAAAILPHLLDVLAREGCPIWNWPMWRALGTLARPLLLEQVDALRGPLDGTEEPF